MDDRPQILVTLSTFAAYDPAPLNRLAQSGFRYAVNPSGKRMTPDEVIAAGAACLGLIAGVEPYKAETLDRLPRLKAISRVGVGIDSIDLEACRRREIAVLNTPDEPAIAVAELTLAMMLGLLRKLVELTALTRARRWQRIPGNLLAGKTVGIVGLGRIGRRVAGLVRAFGAVAVACDPVQDTVWTSANDVRYLPFEDLLRVSDIVTLHASGGENGLYIGTAEIAAMKSGALLINMARGGMVDDEALAEALASGHLGGAGLDVFAHEPYMGPLCDSERAILTPHEATLTKETRVAMEDHAVENLINFLKLP